jgi:AcrR family transcriptional regulator
MSQAGDANQGRTRRDVIIQAATDLFYRNGYANVGMRMIADGVGLRPASLYHHFKSKEVILYALGLQISERWMEEARELLYSDAAPRGAMKKFVERAIIFEWENHAAFQVTDSELREMTPDHAAEIRFHKVAYRKMVQRSIERGVESKCFDVANPALTALVVINMLNGVSSWFRPPEGAELHSGSRLTIEQVAANYADLIADHLLA